MMDSYRFTELMENGYPRFPRYVGPRLDLDWDQICASYRAPATSTYQAGDLERQHSIMFSSDDVQRSLSRSASMPRDQPLGADGDPVPSAGSEGGDTEAYEDDRDETEDEMERADAGDAKDPLDSMDVAVAEAADEPITTLNSTATGAAAEEVVDLTRTRTQQLAAESGLDEATARRLLQEHDRVAGGSS